MLELIRKYRSLFMVIFVLSSLGMVISMFGSNRTAGVSGATMGNGIAARVSDEEVSTQELMVGLQRRTQQMEEVINQQANSNPETRKFLEQMLKSQVSPDSVLNQLIQRKFLLSTARDMGLVASKESIRGTIQSNPVFQKDGHFDPFSYRQMVSDPGLYEQEIASQISITALSKVFQSAFSISSPQEQQERNFLGKKLKLATLMVNPSSFPQPASVSSGEVADYLKNPASQTQIKNYYEQNKARFVTDDQIHARHILIKDENGGEAKAKEVLAEIDSKKITFEEAAKKYSTDASNKDKGGDLGFFGKGAMLPEFEQAAFGLASPGDRVKLPVKTQYGYHLIELIARKAGSKRSLDEAKNEIAQTVLLNEKKLEKAREWVQATIASGKVPPEAETTRLGLKWNDVEWTPLDVGLGPVANLQDQRAAVVALNADKPLLNQALTQGESLVLVKYVGAGAPAVAGAGKGGQAADLSPSQQRTQAAYEFFLRSRFDDLEKRKKIVRSDKVLIDLRTRWASQTAPN